MAKIEKVLLILPNALWAGTRRFNIHPYAMCILGAVIKNDFQVTILDANAENLTLDDTVERIVEHAPDVLGISSMSIEYAKASHELAATVKKRRPETITILGGAYPTLLPEFAIKDTAIDFLVLSEGEYRFRELLFALKNDKSFENIDGIAFRNSKGPVINPHMNYITDLDNVPFPDYSLVDFPYYTNQNNRFSLYNNPRFLPYAVTISSRGCPFNCVFCSSKNIQGKACRMRSAENVLAEIDNLVKDHGIREIIFMDDNLLLNRKRTEAILRGLIERQYDLHWKATNVPTFSLDEPLLELMKKSGCYQITLPIESGNPYVLKNIIKKPLDLDYAEKVIKSVKAMDFETACLFVIGLPGETWDQILETVAFADKIDVDWVVFSIATPLPKTELYDIAKAKGYLLNGFDFSEFKFFGYGHGSIATEEFTPSELEMLRAIEWDRINFRTKEKQEKIALMNSITMDELKQWRISTRRNVGGSVKFDSEEKKV